ncbi:MAG TPA: HD domain-containing phosphohydrolase [Myxococcales bacterium]|nr:HD domain-containing phosphohydrolase [Myxococcales bacterium]
METAQAGSSLDRDLVAADGRFVAARGRLIGLDLLREVAQAAQPNEHRHRPLYETSLAAAALEAFGAPALTHLVGTPKARGEAANTVAEVRFPDAVWEELDLLRTEDPGRFEHGFWTALVAARLFRSALGDAPAVSRMVGGALVHDIGMRYVSPTLRWKREHLTRAEALKLEQHPIYGALVLASALGDAPAVHCALLHHTRAGLGYPRISGLASMRGLDLVAVASAFAALVSPRPFRPQPYDPRGATDQLIEEASAGHFDPRAVRLLIHCLRGAKGPFRDPRLPRKLTGFRPQGNLHGVAGCSPGML